MLFVLRNNGETTTDGLYLWFTVCQFVKVRKLIKKKLFYCLCFWFALGCWRLSPVVKLKL